MVSTASGSNTPPPIALKITVKRPVATTRCDFDIPAIHLADYEVHMP
jgi:hypothetical protein